MSRLLRLMANGLWLLSAWPESQAFQRAVHRVAGTQQRLLLRVLAQNRATEFGRRHGFAAIRSVAEFQERVPLSTYDDYRPLVERIGDGYPHLLTREPVRLLEPTSGSTAARKLIPYTAALRAEFQRAIAPWIADMFLHHPCLLDGQAYWSVSPATGPAEQTSGGIPIGFADDSEYLGPLQRRLVQSVMAVPSQVRLLTDPDAFRYVSLLFLLRSRPLALISIWNPTFLTLLCAPLRQWWPQLADEIERGGLAVAAPIDPGLRAALAALNRPDPRRAAEVRAAFQAGGAPGEIHARLWPALRLISCWTDAGAAPYVPALQRLFPQAAIQGKGLLATEGVVTFPLIGQAGAPLAVRSHFYEFLPVDGGPPRLAHELEPGAEYAVVITTGGGLYRYQLHDVVSVAGHLGDCPLLRFVGKEAHISDWFGEKLNERHVRHVLDHLFARHRIQPAFAMVACEEAAGQHAYTLFIEAPDAGEQTLRQVGHELEQALGENFHYQYCRRLGQLAPARVYRVAGGGTESYLSACRSRGQRLGDIKPVALHRQGGWARAFRGHWLSPAP